MCISSKGSSHRGLFRLTFSKNAQNIQFIANLACTCMRHIKAEFQCSFSHSTADVNQSISRKVTFKTGFISNSRWDTVLTSFN